MSHWYNIGDWSRSYYLRPRQTTQTPPERRPPSPPIDVASPAVIPPWPQRCATLDLREDALSYVLRHRRSHPFAVNAAINERVKLWKGDITRLQVDAIVNAANSGMWAGGGICGAIHSAAGRELERESVGYVDLHGNVPTGNALVTNAYKLHARRVFHAVGPTNGDEALLRRCYVSCLEQLSTHQCRSIAFPCISTGIFGFDNTKAARIALFTVREWLEDEAHQAMVDCVLFCVFTKEDDDLYQALMPCVFPIPDDDDAAEDADDASRAPPHRQGEQEEEEEAGDRKEDQHAADRGKARERKEGEADAVGPDDGNTGTQVGEAGQQQTELRGRLRERPAPAPSDSPAPSPVKNKQRTRAPEEEEDGEQARESRVAPAGAVNKAPSWTLPVPSAADGVRTHDRLKERQRSEWDASHDL